MFPPPVDQAEEGVIFVDAFCEDVLANVFYSRVPQQLQKAWLTRAPLFCFLNKGLIAGAHSLGYVSCASKTGNTPAGAGTGAFDFRKK